MEPPEKKVIANKKPNQRNTWSKRGLEGWYMVPALEHCRCHRIFVTETRSEHIADIVDFFHKM